jgi:predicted CopG family antitoxin
MTTITIRKDTRLRLQTCGKMGQTFDEVINELIGKSGILN